MKRLLIVTALAALTVGLAGCGRNWGQWWNRGGWCAPGNRQQTTYMPYAAPVEVYEEGDAITVPGPATLPPLPGPAR
jgi:hypothetical protein